MINLTPRDRLQYALKVQRLHDVIVLKDDIHLQYKYKNINRATTQAVSFQDKIIDAVIENVVSGTSDPITSSNIMKGVENIIDTNLKNDAKRISYGIPEKAVNAAVSNISNRYQFILGNRIREEIPNLQGKIEDYINTKNLVNLSEAELTQKLKAEYGDHAQKRIQNIVRDSFHTNECNLSWVKAVYDGYSYKIWNNGRTKRTRVWHKAKFIQSVPIDETFDIFGSYPARMMYPGDLNGGAENVANCKCWLSYSNRPPSDLRGTGKKTTTKKSSKSSKSKNNNGLINKVKNAAKKPVNTINSKIKTIGEKVTHNSHTPNLISKVKSSIEITINNIFSKSSDKSYFKSFNSKNSSKKINWKVTNVKNLSNDVPVLYKDLIEEFESEIEKITNGNEWGQVYNVTKGFIDEIMSDDNPLSVSPLKKKDYGKDFLIVIHSHTSDEFFSPKDIGKLLASEENIIGLIAITPNKIFIVKPNIFGSIGEDNAKKVYEQMEEIFAKHYFYGSKLYGYSSQEEAFEGMEEEYIRNKNINNYIDSWLRFKK